MSFLLSSSVNEPMPALSVHEQLTHFLMHYAISLVKHTREQLDDSSTNDSDPSSADSMCLNTESSFCSWDLSGSHSNLELEDIDNEDYHNFMWHIYNFL